LPIYWKVQNERNKELAYKEAITAVRKQKSQKQNIEKHQNPSYAVN
jgi:hypothetical protein